MMKITRIEIEAFAPGITPESEAVRQLYDVLRQRYSLPTLEMLAAATTGPKEELQVHNNKAHIAVYFDVLSTNGVGRAIIFVQSHIIRIAWQTTVDNFLTVAQTSVDFWEGKETDGLVVAKAVGLSVLRHAHVTFAGMTIDGEREDRRSLIEAILASPEASKA